MTSYRPFLPCAPVRQMKEKHGNGTPTWTRIGYSRAHIHTLPLLTPISHQQSQLTGSWFLKSSILMNNTKMYLKLLFSRFLFCFVHLVGIRQEVVSWNNNSHQLIITMSCINITKMGCCYSEVMSSPCVSASERVAVSVPALTPCIRLSSPKQKHSHRGVGLTLLIYQLLLKKEKKKKEKRRNRPWVSIMKQFLFLFSSSKLNNP